MSEVVLSAAEHFEALREGVWARLAARPGVCTRERFDEAYAEWWAREVERAAAGRPSRASAPVAYLTESVHRVLIDEGRARARGLARGEKAALEVVDLESQIAAASPANTEGQAGYEALVHRVLTLVQGTLSARELRVFVYSFLYLAPTERTAEALGLSVARVKKDREKVVRKVGGRVWEVLQGELDLCVVYDRKALGAVFEILSVHVEDCPTCAKALGGLRHGALSVMPPAQVLVAGAATESVSDAVSHAYDSLMVRVSGLAHRAGETFAAMPAGGRTAAVVAVAASAVAGGAATVSRPHRARVHPAPRKVAARPTATPRPAPTAAVHVRPRPAHVAAAATSRAVATVQRQAVRVERERFAAAAVTPSATAVAQRERIGFESVVAPAPSAHVASRLAPAAAVRPSREFGFEHP